MIDRAGSFNYISNDLCLFNSGSSAGSSQPWISDLKMDLESNGRTRWRLEFLLILVLFFWGGDCK